MLRSWLEIMILILTLRLIGLRKVYWARLYSCTWCTFLIFNKVYDLSKEKKNPNLTNRLKKLIILVEKTELLL